MRKKIISLLGVTVIVSVLAGCAGSIQKEAGKNDVVSSSAVQHETVEDNFGQNIAGVEIKEKHYPYANKTNFYRVGKKKRSILQYSMDGKKQKEIELPCENVRLILVEEDAIYYQYENRWEDQKICKMPIRKNKKGMDEVLVDKEKVLWDDWEIILSDNTKITKRYILSQLLEDQQYYKYDRKKKKVCQLENPLPEGKTLLDSSIIDVVDNAAYMYVNTDEDMAYLFRQKLDTNQWENIGEAPCIDYYPDAMNERFLCYVARQSNEEYLSRVRPEVRCYDVVENRQKTIVEYETLRRVLSESQNLKDEKISKMQISHLFLNQSQLFIQIYFENEEGHLRYAMFSVEIASPYTVNYERELTECAWGNDVSKDKKNLGQNYYFLYGKFFVIPEYIESEKEIDTIKCYDINTKTASVFSKQEEEFYWPYHNDLYAYKDIGGFCY